MSQRIYAMGFCQTLPYMEPSISPSTIMEAAFGRLHNSGAGAFGARPTVVESIMVDGEIDGSIYSALAIYSAVADNRLVCGSGLLVLLIQAYSGLIQPYSQKKTNSKMKKGFHDRVPNSRVRAYFAQCNGLWAM